MKRDRLTAQLVLPLLLFCLALRSAIPAGWMPEFGEGSVSLVPCSGWVTPDHSGHDGGQSAHASHHGSKDQKPAKSHHDMSSQPCSFAAAAVDLTQQDDGPAPASAIPTERQFTLAPAVAVGRGLAAPPPPQTGPPLLA